MEVSRTPSFGAAYYHEYMPGPRLEQDLDLMVAAGFTMIRVGESVWSRWEPREGEFDLEWLAPIVDAAHQRGIGTVLGTPTYAVPPWLMVAHPEIAAESATGTRVPWGARQEMELGHPAYRHYAERIIRKVVARYADHPGIVGYQVDNEPGTHLAHNVHVMAEFRRYLGERYPDLVELSRRWNLAHWAHEITDFSQLWTPDGNLVPQYDLEWRRFHARRTTEFIAWQAAIVAEYRHPHQFVMTCVDRLRPASDDRSLSRATDVSAANLYIGTQSSLRRGEAGDPAFPPSGWWAPFYAADRAWAMAGGPFLVTETNAGTIGHPWYAHPPYDGQWRQIAWAMLARGATGISYWNWHSMHGSWEMYWNGILPHSLEPGRAYAEISKIGEELRATAELIGGLTPDAPVALVVSNDTQWLWEFQSPVPRPGASASVMDEPDRTAYESLVYRLYAGASEAGLQLRIVHAADVAAMGGDEFAARHPVAIAASLAVAGDDLVQALRAYALAGGHLLATFRTCYGDDLGSPRPSVQPYGLADLAGIRHAEATNTDRPVPVTGELSGHAERFIEYLEPEGAQVLAGLDHPQWSRWAAVTTRPAGAGRITYLGCFPDLELTRSLMRWIAVTTPAADSDPDWSAAAHAAGVALHSATSRDGRRVRILHRMDDAPAVVTPPTAAADAVSGVLVASIDIDGWGVRVLVDGPDRPLG